VALVGSEVLGGGFAVGYDFFFRCTTATANTAVTTAEQQRGSGTPLVVRVRKGSLAGFNRAFLRREGLSHGSVRPAGPRRSETSTPAGDNPLGWGCSHIDLMG
jgi:hypothetical protein